MKVDDREPVVKIPATVVILTKNESRHVARAVSSGAAFAEILVIDSASTDETVLLAEKSGATVIQFEWDKGYPKKKEWALAHCTHDWVVYLDADEYLTPELVDEIRSTVEDRTASAFEVPLRYYWCGVELKFGHRVSKRIGMRRSAAYWPRPDDLHVQNMWEVEGHYQPQVKAGSVRKLSAVLGHQDEDGLYDYFARHNRYSDWEAHMIAAKDKASLESRSPLGRLAVNAPAKPLLFFAYSYLIRQGFRDGRAGFDYGLALAFYYWQIGVKRREIARLVGV
ncbi:glycosyl transferase [Zafaria cholistanensis]|uniref:Glycosyl transferase n=1 Tax=Zafaria cholistanensis TaxID=1682741 RepID=A0A5A7NNS2_9MICC|nr:glycosyltransferase family 2 protein [Zafaria cholistanensis]GER21697.1 glycosyl transferase [Zafaria cholistanensis]